MNIGWIYPHREKCGIAIYARNYIATAALAGSVTSIDPQWWIHDRDRIITEIRKCDLVHIQYDTASFMTPGHDFFHQILCNINVPVVVSLHEVYREDPFVYPRSALRGIWPVKKLRRILYDYRHPVQCSFNRHVNSGFYACRLIVHHEYHRTILTEKHIDPSIVTVIPLPVKQTRFTDAFSFRNLPKLSFGSVGFISAAYDYDLLFSVLERFERPWTFTWIGGPRSDDGRAVLDRLHERIDRHRWNDRFTITGWVSETEQTACLDRVDIVLAFFALRSSSASLTTAMGALKPVCITRLPLAEEIAGYRERTGGDQGGSPLIVADVNRLSPLEAPRIVDHIESFVANRELQHKLLKNLVAYVEAVSFERCGEMLINLYHELGAP